jgi:hypothetical protein
MTARENIDWTLLEPRDAKGEAAGFGRWQDHTYNCHRLGDGLFAVTHQQWGGEPTVLKTGVTGHLAWRAARDDCTKQQHLRSTQREVSQMESNDLTESESHEEVKTYAFDTTMRLQAVNELLDALEADYVDREHRDFDLWTRMNTAREQLAACVDLMVDLCGLVGTDDPVAAFKKAWPNPRNPET